MHRNHSAASTKAEPVGGTPRWRLFTKYTVLIGALVIVALLAGSLINLYFSYRETRAKLFALQQEQANAAAGQIGQFIQDIEHQMGWTALPTMDTSTNPLEQQRFEYLKLLRQVPAITEAGWLDAHGHEQLRVSRVDLDRVGRGTDFSRDPRFTAAAAGHTWFGPVYFRKGTEPYMSISQPAGVSTGGVSVVEVNLKFVWDVITRIRIGDSGIAYVVDAAGKLVAHPDISLVLKMTSLAHLPQIAASTRTPDRAVGPTAPRIARDLSGREVLSAQADIPALGWTVLVDLPSEEAFAPVYHALYRTGALLLTGLLLSVIASLALARRMVRPIRTLQAGAEKIGAGELNHRINVNTGDELEDLAQRFNAMAAKLEESYDDLERKVEQRTAELWESLEHQTATSEILRVIAASPGDLQPVFDIIAERAASLCSGNFGLVFGFDGEWIQLKSIFGMSPEGVEAMRRRYPLRPGSDSVAARTVSEGAVINVSDVFALPEYAHKDAARIVGFRAAMGVPMVRQGQIVGAITVTRAKVGCFSDKQTELLKTFADQAVIAIENVRLFNELQTRTQELAAANADLTEALAHQTATSEILGVIAGSREDIQPVFDAIARSASKLCDANFCAVFTFDGTLLNLVAHHNVSPESLAVWNAKWPAPADPITAVGRATHDCAVIQIPDVDSEPGYGDYLAVARAVGYRSIVGVPLLREGKPVGALALSRAETGFLPEKQVALLKTFADQAAIAMENVRLFQELQARTTDLARSVEELKALSEVGQAVSSTLDLQTVLTTLVSRATQLSGCHGGVIYEFRETSQTFHVMATHRMDPQHLEAVRDQPVRLGEGAMGRAGAIRAPVQVADILDENEPVAPQARPIVARLGFRSLLAIPLLREQRLLGGLVVWREASGRFADEVVRLLQTFAAQSVLAIQNARLFREIQGKGRELEIANRHKSEFLANMSHELRTPLNAIIGFSEVMRERMFGELNAKQAEYIEDIHSSGQHLLSLINDILDLSKIEAGRMELHMASFNVPAAIKNTLLLVRGRAARHGVQLAVHIDPTLGDVTADELKFKQILLNLLSNAVKFTPKGGTISVSAARGDGSVEVSVSDTGIGIPLEQQEAIFEEFRQAKMDGAPKPEGTGLGLALSRKFVELHGGKIQVRSEPARGSVFTFTLPGASP
jgi:two-component system, NtrC family, sensor kinase